MIFDLYTDKNCSSDTKTFASDRFVLWFRILYTSLSIFALLLIFTGIIGNVFNLVVFRKLPFSIPYTLMAWIAVLDNIRLVVNIIDFPIHLIDAFLDGLSPLMMKATAYSHSVVLLLETGGSNSSKYILVFLSLMQYVSVSRPFVKVKCRNINGTAIGLTILQFALCSPYLFLLKVEACENIGIMHFTTSSNSIRLYRAYIEFAIHPVIPAIACIVVTILLLLSIRHSNKFRREINIKTLSISKSIIKLNITFIFCNLPHFAYATLYLYGYGPSFPVEARKMIIFVADLSACINSSVNFFIYYSTNAHFKEQIIEIFCFKSWTRRRTTPAITIEFCEV